MTREEEEAIAYGKRVIGLGLNDETQAFCELAIKALEPCEDAISRQAVNRLVWRYLKKATDENIAFYEHFLELPSVTPQPKTGHWIYDNFNWRCSECNETPKTMGYVGSADFMTEHFKFCNHCGAKMVKQESEE